MCEYCDFSGRSSTKPETGVTNTMDFYLEKFKTGDDRIEYYINAFSDSDDDAVRIHYCPYCGRKLEE